MLPVVAQTTGLLLLSNLSMTVAWYGHLRHFSNRSRLVSALFSESGLCIVGAVYVVFRS